MKSKMFAKKVLLLVCLAVLFVGCKSKGPKKGAGKDDVAKLIEAYGQENAILNGEVTKKDKEIETLKAELAGLQQKGQVDDEVINKLKALVGQGDTGVWEIDPIRGIILDSDVTFASGSEVLSSKGQSNIKKLLDTGYLKEGTIFVVGHTDSDPISKTKNKHSSNFELSAKRAAHVAEQLVALGVQGERIVIQAHGEFKPRAGKSKREQRRIEFRVAK